MAEREAGTRPNLPRTLVRAVVVDDEPAAREAISTLIADEPAVRVVADASNGKEAVEVVRRLRPDLLFLDVQMPDMDGFQVLETLGSDAPRGVVFVTAHDEHAIRAFEVHALDYLLKPFGRPRFRAAVSRALERLTAMDALTLQRTLASLAAVRGAGEEDVGELAIGMLSLPDEPRERPRRLGVRTGSKVVLVEIGAIDWIEASDDYVRVHTGPTSYLVSERMQTMEQLLDAGEFLRIHRSVIVNLGRISELHRDSEGGGAIVLRDGVRLRVARGRWDALAGALGVREV